MPGLFLPSRVLDLLYKINTSPTEDKFSEVALLSWIDSNEVKRYFRDINEEDLHLFKQDQLRDQWKDSDLYKTNSCQQL